MGALRLKKACCCFSLRTGNLILGWFGLVISSCSCMAGITLFLLYYKELQRPVENIKLQNKTELFDVDEDWTQPHWNELDFTTDYFASQDLDNATGWPYLQSQDRDEVVAEPRLHRRHRTRSSSSMTKKELRYHYLIALIVFSFINVCVFICHLYGSYKYRKSYLMPLLVVGGLELAYEIETIFDAIAIPEANHHTFTAGIISFLFSLYFYLIPLSFFIDSLEKGPALQTNLDLLRKNVRSKGCRGPSTD